VRPRNIAVLIGGLGFGGSERQLYLFLSHCDRQCWQPVLYVSGALGFWEGPVRMLGVPVTLLHGDPLSKLRQFRSAIIEQGATCFFSWSSYTNGFGFALLGLGGFRIGSFRNADFSDLPRRMRGAWRWMSLRGISLAICNSRETLAAIADTRGLKSVFVPNAVEVFPHDRVQAHRRQWRGRFGLDDSTILVVGVGRLTPQKCFSRFIDTIARVARECPVQAVIAGEDRGCQRELEEKVARLGLQGRVRLVGIVSDARELICAADIYLLTSDHEGMPNVVLEAMAAGITCVATKVNGVRDLIEPGVTGFLANRDADELARYVISLGADPDLRRGIGQRARALVEREYRPEQIMARLWALCDQRAPVH
jgi:glycosyltransferase involved in cell wall biosynthesis